ncbi:7-carboxy-7-deazaguanine synthase QueE [Pseudonocardia saturnea]|uniref:7-carboxy-7-deazaguanine synthase n=3 Tax=Pseudonocardia TaxID=1847 RepID=A0A1Y2MGK1_PSEAH|nr:MULTISPECIES: 7-carboxy-7-deazaguanine synthase QueE [Pseudonocardia]OSY34390.1 7-carboxy-7-deazaguanine synthase [Pseudonocardia autotrophica]TDN76377.1 7-cyano-7-deazaguanosine (preQ0) biosynthesis protein QueE [Pseudonocardia autotrophica]BBG00364.1 7-carboxy-7-deazaguanine synthase [Pseudonocardia autotrophica]GEC29788.1 7-carboxy-7-deazaguanine synthase [Pseudonocardia saturnea]
MTAYRGVLRPGASELLVSEVFGPTLQGEGPSAGRAAVFLRLGMCNLACAWCDTSYTWDRSSHDLAAELRTTAVVDLVRDVLSRAAPLVVVTGGEPLLQRTTLLSFVRAVSAAGRRVEFETSGSVAPGGLATLVDRFVVSPKLSNSRQSERARLRWGVLHEFAALRSTEFKFVVSSPSDLAEVDEIAARLALAPQRIWVMPEGTTREAVIDGLAALAPGVNRRGWSLSGRMHVLLWGNERAR